MAAQFDKYIVIFTLIKNICLCFNDFFLKLQVCGDCL